MEVKSNKKILLIARLIFLLFSFLFLGLFNGEFLYKTQNVSYFVFSDMLQGELMGQSAGGLMYVASYLTQFLYYPLLGAAMLALLLLLIECLMACLTGSVVLSFGVAGLVLLTQTSVGYAIYDHFFNPIIFAQPLGLIVAILLTMLYKRFSANDYAAYIVIGLGAVIYFWVGAYLYFSFLFIAISEVLRRGKAMMVKAVLAVALCFLLPYIASQYIYHENYFMSLIAPIPDTYFLNIFILSFISLFGFALSPLYAGRVQTFAEGLVERWAKIWMPLVAVVLWCGVIFWASYREEAYHTEFKLQRLAESHQWDDLLKEANKVEEPTKTIYAYRLIALGCQNRLADQMFNYPCTFKHITTNYVSEQPRYFEDLFLYASYINNAYLWSMEFWCTTGYSYEHLKKMAIGALINDEPTLADKYIQVLKRTLFQRQWAEEYEEYVGHTDKLYAKYPEFAIVKENMPKDCLIATLDPLRKVYSQYTFLSMTNAERRLLADLYSKDLKAFAKDAKMSHALYAKSQPPKCVQEALILVAMQQRDPSILQGFNVSKALVNEMQYMYSILSKHKSKEVAQKALSDFKGRYCYFYLFANN